MQVTDAMVEAAIRAYRALPVAPETLQMDGILMRDAIQAALEAAPERDDVEPPPFVVALSEERLRLFPTGAADAVRKLLASRTAWRNFAREREAEFLQLRRHHEKLQAQHAAAGHDLHVPVRIHVEVDEPAFRAAVAAAVNALPAALPRDDQGRINIATLDDDLAPRTGGRVWLPAAVVPDEMLHAGPFHNEGGDLLPGLKRYRTRQSTSDNLEEPTVPEDTEPGTPSLPVTTPAAFGSFTAQLGGDYNPLKLIGAGQIAGHLGVPLAQVEEWIELGATIRFPEPLKRSIAGNRWQVGAIDQWYELWKASNGG